MSYYRQLILTDPYLLNQIAYYPFNTNSNDLINSQNGTDTAISYANAGIVGNSATFNGTSSMINIADNDNFSFGTGAFSINIWVYPVGNSGYLISKRNASFIEYQSTYNITTSQIVIQLYSGGTTTNFIGRTLTGTLIANTWNMVTFTSSGGTAPANIKGYLNGTLLTGTNQSLGTYTGIANTTAGVILGRLGSAASGYFNGRLDQTRIWKGRELTSTEITDMYNTLY